MILLQQRNNGSILAAIYTNGFNGIWIYVTDLSNYWKSFVMLQKCYLFLQLQCCINGLSQIGDAGKAVLYIIISKIKAREQRISNEIRVARSLDGRRSLSLLKYVLNIRRILLKKGRIFFCKITCACRLAKSSPLGPPLSPELKDTPWKMCIFP